MLAIISFKNIGTKIAVSNNKIYVQSPNAIQGALRWTYGNNREEIHYLYKPIFRALNMYKNDKNEDLKEIFKFSVSGLKLLKNSYNNNSSTLCHAIDLYINIIENTLNNSLPDMEPIRELDDLKLSCNTRLNLENLFSGLWNNDEIKLICTMLKLASNSDCETKSYIGALESILSTKEQLVNKIILDANKLIE